MPHGEKFKGNFYENQTQKTSFWRKLLRKSHKNQTQKTKFLEKNAVKIVLFEKKTFFNFCSIFVKKKNNKKMSLCGDLEIFGEGNCGTYSKSCRVEKIFGQQRLQFVVQTQNKKNVILGEILKPYFLTMKFVWGICCTYTKICRFGEISGVQKRPKFLLQIQNKTFIWGRFWSHIFLTIKR
jgi:hypothetical protein